MVQLTSFWHVPNFMYIYPMKTIILILLAFGMRAQNKAPEPFTSKYNSEVHFYGAFLVNDIAYSAQGLAFPDWTPTKKLVFSNAMTLATITAKEVYDVRKAKPTGFGWTDFFVGLWSMAIYTIFRICLNNFREVGLIPRKKKDKYSLAKDI